MHLRKFVVSLFLCFFSVSAGSVIATVSYAQTAEKQDYATVIMYHRFGESGYPSTNIKMDQFEAHLEYLATGDFSVLSLQKIIETMLAGGTLPGRTIAITIDDAYLSVYEKAWPLLKQYGFPFTLFVATDPIDRKLRNYMDWDQIRELQSDGVIIGSQTKSHPHMHLLSPIQVEEELALSNNRFLEEIGLYPQLFAYPYGEYSLDVVKAVKDTGFISAFGQNSGVMYANDNMFELPRFAFNERYSSIDRLELAVNAKPLRVSDITPLDMVISQNPPSFGFTIDKMLTPISQLRCFSSDYGQVDVEILGPRAEIRLPGPIKGPRSRINCTMPADNDRWRWFGRQFLISN